MKAAVYHGPGDIRVEEVPRPTPAPGEVLVRVRACGICGSDLHVYRHGLFEELGRPLPGRPGRIMGHEFAGEVVEVGSAVRGVRPGERVAGLGRGAFAEYVTVEVGERSLHVLPPHVSFEEAATLEPLATSVQGVQLAAPRPGETVVVLGAGAIGLGCLQVLKATTATRVIVVSGSPARLALARSLGADAIVDRRAADPLETVIALTGGAPPVPRLGFRGGRADVVIECAGRPGAPQEGVQMLKPFGGRLVLLALYEQPATLDLNQVVRKQVTVQGSWSFLAEQMRTALDLVATGRVGRRALITHRLPLEEAPAAFALQERGAGVKVLLVP